MHCGERGCLACYPSAFRRGWHLAGFSNMISGLLGAGFTGSYIFSQTIFSMRAHIKSKVHGIIISGKWSINVFLEGGFEVVCSAMAASFCHSSFHVPKAGFKLLCLGMQGLSLPSLQFLSALSNTCQSFSLAHSSCCLVSRLLLIGSSFHTKR